MRVLGAEKQLLETMEAIGEAADQDCQRVQEFNSTCFWLMKAIKLGVSETMKQFNKEVKGVIDG